MLPYARLTPGPGFVLHRAALYYAQRLVTGPAARQAAAALIAAVVRGLHGDGMDRGLEAEEAQALAALKREGVALLSPLAFDSQIAGIAAYFMGRPAIGPQGERRLPRDLAKDASFAAYDLATVLGCPGVIELVNSPSVLRIAASYLGCKPTLSSLGVRWSFPGAGPESRYQGFHRDVDDWRFLKLFIYLTDVCVQSGPHVYARGSHRSGFGVRARAYQLGELESRFGVERMLTVTGPRGTTFMADTLGVHRGAKPALHPRLILQAQYSILPVFAFRYRPLRLGRPVDSYSNRLLLRL